MPRGPRGQKRPADVVSNAVLVARIATGEEAESLPNEAAATLGRAGGRARSQNLSAARKKQIGRKAAAVRWKKRGGNAPK